jgi:hypothetical protein
VSQDIDLDS